MLIGLNGSKGSGKDTVGQYLVENYGFERLSFAEKLKVSAAALFDVTVEMWEEWKNDDTMKVAVYKAGDDIWFPAPEGPQIMQSVRYFLQRYGTEAHRNIFGDDFWVDALFRDYDGLDGKNYVITDARFSNELKKVKELGGYNINIKRRRDVSEDSHISESPPPPIYIDAWFDNHSTFERLYKQVDNFIDSFGTIHKHGSLSKTAT